MPLWGSVDNAANSDIAAVIQYNKATTAANQALLFGNTTADAFVTNTVVGQFGVDTNEIRASTTGHGYHAGWVLRKEGTGLRAGRVTYETLVAMGSMSGDAEDSKFPDYRISIVTQPSSNSAQTNHNVTFTVVSTSVPSTTLSYNWQRNSGGGWTNVLNTSGVWYGNTSATLTANVNVANANTLRVQVSATGAATVTSTNATVTLLP